MRLSDTIRGWAFRQNETKLGLSFEMSDMSVQLDLHFLALKTRIKRRQSWNGLLRHGKILVVEFDADSVVTHRLGRRDSRTRAQERVKNGAFAQRQERTNQNPHEVLRLQTRMVRDGFLALGRPSAGMASGNGLSTESRRSAPVFHVLKFSATVRSPMGL